MSHPLFPPPKKKIFSSHCFIIQTLLCSLKNWPHKLHEPLVLDHQMDAPENINSVGGEEGGMEWKAHFVKEMYILSTPTLLKTDKFYHLRIILLKSDHRQKASVVQVQWTHVKAHWLLSCTPRKPAIKTEVMFWLIQLPEGKVVQWVSLYFQAQTNKPGKWLFKPMGFIFL